MGKFDETWYESSETLAYQLIIFCSNDNPGLTLTFLRHGQILQIKLLYGKM